MEPALKFYQGRCARRAILILGMHRSGTSVVTRTLGLRGATLPLHVIPPGFDNETGFWEPLEIVRIHDQILQSAGSSWDDAAAFSEAWFTSDVAQSFKAQLIDALIRDFPDAPPLFALKDPRLCLLVPLWLSILHQLEIEPLFVIPVRNPLEIAASLRQRNSIQEEHSLLLWTRHFLAAERTTRDYKRSFIGYDNLLRDWRGTVDKIGQDIGVNWPRQSPASDVEITRLISTALRHHHYSDTQLYLRKNVSDWVKTVFRWAMCATEQPMGDFKDVDAVSDCLRIADVTFMPLVADGKLSIMKLNDDLKNLAKVNTHKDHELGELKARLTAEVEQLHEQLQSDQTVLSQLRSQVDAGNAVSTRLRLELQSAHEEIRQKANESIAARLRAEARISDLQADYDQSQSEMAELKLRYEVIITSTSWRVLGPVRSAAVAVPPSVRKYLRLGMKILYWIATPQRTAQRLAFMRTRQTDATPSGPVTTVTSAETSSPATSGSAKWPRLVSPDHLDSPAADANGNRKREGKP
jgi:hypothetical protein